MSASLRRKRGGEVPRVIVGAALVAFGVLHALAIRLYPGGTSFDPGTEGYSFGQNYLCDLTHAVAYNAMPNPAAGLARASMLAISVGLSAFFWRVPQLLPATPREATLMRWLGVLALPGLFAVTLDLAHVLGVDLHSVAVFSAVIPGLSAALLAERVCFRARREHPVLAWAGVMTIGAALVDSVLYGLALAGAMAESSVIPAIQTLSLISLIIWMASTLRGRSKAS